MTWPAILMFDRLQYSFATDALRAENVTRHNVVSIGNENITCTEFSIKNALNAPLKKMLFFFNFKYKEYSLLIQLLFFCVATKILFSSVLIFECFTL